MGSFKEIDDFFNNLTDQFLRDRVPDIIAETATAYFKERFTTKEWDGKPWLETKKPVKRGTLMVRSGDLVNSIKPSLIIPEKIVISGGSNKVKYARAHNEGETITINVTPKMKRFAWAMHYKEQQEGKKEVNTVWKGLALTKKTALTIKMPERRFMGTSENLNNALLAAIKLEFNKL